jgi:outer membrane protein assembly factor BamB
MKITCIAVLLALIPPTPPDPEWSGQWRGPNRDGLSPETGLLKQWPSGGPSLAWKATGVGIGFSGLSAGGGRIFTMGDVTDACFLFALNPADGKVAWKLRVGAHHLGKDPAKVDEKYPGPRATPSTDGTLVFALAPGGELVCATAADGKEKWRKHLRTDFGGRVGGWRYSESPLLDGDLIVCTPGGSKGAVLALKKETGEPVWQSKEFTDAAEYASLVPVEIGGVKQYLVLTKPHVAGIAAKDGKLLWQADRPAAAKTPAVCPTPVHKDGIVFASSGYGVGSNAFRITATGDQFKAEEIYAGKEMENHHGGMILVGDHLYGLHDRGHMVCLDFKTGQEAWRGKSVGKGSIAYADGHFVVRSEEGKGQIALVEATPSGYKEKGRFDQPDRSSHRSWPHPVIAGGKLYIRDQDVLLCYDIKAK